MKLNWNRFWFPRSKTINLSDNGFLYDPETTWGSILNPNLVSFESISHTPCLVLIGEPGMGKTHALQMAKEKSAKKHHTFFVDLRSCGSDASLYRNLFEHKDFLTWKESDSSLHLFLDSLDECLLRIDYICSILIEELKKCPLDRLYIRIACRSADWPRVLENDLISLWGDENVKVYELAPLLQKDVADAARINDINEEEFFQVIWEKSVVPFAIKPVTLKFLLNLYKRNGNLPSTQKELFLEGCRLLCEETNDHRISGKNTGNLSAQERLTIASRIAAIMVFSNRFTIWKGIDLGEVPAEDVTIQELSYGGNRQYNDQLVVSENDIGETVSTGLFTSRGLDQMGWAHQTYSEFLAALFLVENKFSLEQTLSLIVHPNDIEGRLVPQLHEVAAWLAIMNPELFHEVMKRDPEVLLRSDVATVDNKDKELLVSALLKQFQDERLLDLDYGIEKRYVKLSHPNLSKQLREQIMDRNKNIFVRRVAINIVRACEVKELQNDLVTLALDQSEELEIRSNAAYALTDIGDDKYKIKLIPLAKSECGDDANDDLKGATLQGLWPELITAGDLFALLTNPRRGNYLGSYRMFLSQHLLEELQPTDLPIALGWIKRQKPYHELRSSFQELVTRILKLAWENLQCGNVLSNIVDLVVSRLGDNEQFDFLYEKDKDFQKRRTLLLALLNKKDFTKEKVRYLFFSRLITNADLSWALEKLFATKTREDEIKWVELIKSLFNIYDLEQVEKVYFASQQNKMLFKAVSPIFQAIRLDSDDAKQAKEYYELERKQERHLEKRKRTFQLVMKRKAELFDELESGDLEAWWKLCWILTYNSEGIRSSELEPDITNLPGWLLLGDKEKEIMIRFAKIYILERNAEPDKWMGTNTFYRPDFSGFKAFRLLLKCASEYLTKLNPIVLRNWTPILMAYPVSTGSDAEEARNTLVRWAYQHVPYEIIETLIRLIDEENREKDYISIIRAVKGCWDHNLENALLSKLKDEKLKLSSMRDLLSFLMERKATRAQEYAWFLLTQRYSTDKNQQMKALYAMVELIKGGGAEEWDTLWSIIQSDSTFGQELMPFITSERYSFITRLKERQLADFYIWLVQQYPFSEDLRYEDEEMAHFVTPREQIGDFRDSILRLLKNMGTVYSCKEIERIGRELPNMRWLRWSLLEAQVTARRHTWVPATPADIILMASSNQYRFVQSEEQLLDVLIESLCRLEMKLQGETPQVRWLWNDLGGDRYRPCTENELSDFIKQHLEQELGKKGIVVNREVEIRGRFGSIKGERTDIYVDAVCKNEQGGYDTISVIIEIKGNWHRELNSAMEKQLVDRYLYENSNVYGLYLVGWFESKNWCQNDYRRREVPKISIEQARSQFELQSQQLSKNDVKVKSFVLDLNI